MDPGGTYKHRNPDLNNFSSLIIKTKMFQPSQIEHQPRSKWRARIRLFSMSLPKPDKKLDKKVPLLSSSPLSTPASSPPHLQRNLHREAASFLTPLEVHNDDFFIPLTHQKGVLVGDIILPPPPPQPQRKLLYGESSKPVETFSNILGPARKTRNFSDSLSLSCFICQEHLESKLELEKLVSLKCGDCVHGECLQTVVEYNVSQIQKSGDYSTSGDTPRLRSLIFPKCRGHCCISAQVSALVCPIDQELIESIMFDSLLAFKLVGVSNRTPSNQSPQSEETCQFPLLLECRPDSKYFFKADKILRPRSLFSEVHQRNPHLDITGDSRPVSLAPSSITHATISVRISEHDHIPLEKLKSTFIKHMLDSSDSIDLSMLVALGPLRLVDRLLVSKDFSEFNASQVYLFANYLVVCQCRLPLLLSLNDTTSIQIPELGVIEIVFRSQSVHTVRLNSDTASIIEKWGIALSDANLIVPPEIFTSTLSVFDLEPPFVYDYTIGDQASSIVGINTVTGYTFGKQVSPIQESSLQPSPVESEPTSQYLQSSSIAEHLVRLSVSSELSFLPQISPLKIKRNIASIVNCSDSDSDSDSDNELITEVLTKIQNN